MSTLSAASERLIDVLPDIRDRHHPSGRFPYTARVDMCDLCIADWPCDPSRVLAVLDQTRSAIAAVVGAAREWARTWPDAPTESHAISEVALRDALTAWDALEEAE